MTKREQLDYIIRNANYLETDSFGFAHHRRPDYLMARLQSIEFHADKKLTYVRGAEGLVNKWILSEERDLERLETIQDLLARTFGAPTFSDLIENWQTYVAKYQQNHAKEYEVVSYGMQGFIVKPGENV